MQINLIPDNSVSSAPAGFTAMVQAAAAIYDQDFPGNYTVNITYGWGTVDNQPNSQLMVPTSDPTAVFSLGGGDPRFLIDYATLKSWLSADPAIASLPASNAGLPGFPNLQNGGNSYFISSAQEKALGVYAGDNSAVDGSIGFNVNDLSVEPVADWLQAALQEIGHALGWETGYAAMDGDPSILDLFRYQAPGVFQWNGPAAAYFSLDGGNTDIANFLTSGDYTLFSNAGNVLGDNDPFAFPPTGPGSTATLTSLDIEILNLLGFGLPQVANSVSSELLWRNSNGQLAEWAMNGSAILSSAAPAFNGNAVAPDPSWSIAGSGDFNGDGNADILWRQSSTGALAEWLMNGATITSSAAPTFQGQAVSPDSSWSVLGIGDFNGNGDADILWRQSTTGSLIEWLMNGTTISSSAGVTYQGNALSPASSWSVAGIGDFNGNGNSDILWRQSSTGSLAIWLMNGSAVATSAVPTFFGATVSPDSSWNVAAVGDFNGDGDADLVWRQSTTGSLAMWLMNGPSIQASAAPTYQGSVVAPDLTWNIIAVGNFGGAGTSDILWQQSTSGSLVEWQMSGSTISASVAITSQGSPVAPPSAWQNQAKPTDFA